MHWTELAAVTAAAVAGGMGLYGMVNPDWMSKIVRLVPAPGQVEGRSEFRATYGGLFLFSHAFAAWALMTNQVGAELAAAVVGLSWLGAAAGRCISVVLDKAGTNLNVFNIGFELVFGCAFLAPLLWG